MGRGWRLKIMAIRRKWLCRCRPGRRRLASRLGGLGIGRLAVSPALSAFYLRRRCFRRGVGFNSERETATTVHLADMGAAVLRPYMTRRGDIGPEPVPKWEALGTPGCFSKSV